MDDSELYDAWPHLRNSLPSKKNTKDPPHVEKTTTKAAQSQSTPCGLLPPCASRKNPALENHLAPFHASEQDLIHDVRHLRPGALYCLPGFLLRAESWWSAEASRWLHLKKHILEHRRSKTAKSDVPEATRRQPSRAAKAKVGSVPPKTSRKAVSTVTKQIEKKKTPAEKKKEAIVLKSALQRLDADRGTTRGSYSLPLDHRWISCDVEAMTKELAEEQREGFMQRVLEELGRLAPSQKRILPGHAAVSRFSRSDMISFETLDSIVETMAESCCCEWYPEKEWTPESDGLVAPEAEITISPTLGGWNVHNLNLPAEMGGTAGENKLERAAYSLVEVAEVDGLKFLVDQRGCVRMV